MAANTPEGKVKTWLKQKLKKDLPGVYLYSAPGGRFGVTGTPDLLGTYGGIFFGIEVKADESKKLSPTQIHQANAIANAGGLVAVLKGKDYDRYSAIVRAIRRRAEALKIGSHVQTTKNRC